MVTFREIRDLLAVECVENIIDEDEFLLLYDLNTSKHLDFPYDDYDRIDLDEMDDSECLTVKITEMFLFSEGRRHDSGMLAKSMLRALLEHHTVSLGGMPMSIYIDPAYPISTHLISHYRNRWWIQTFR